MAFERMRIFTGNANPKLAEAVCRHLNISLGRCVVGRFSDGEVMIELLENVRGRDVFILQSTCAPTNDNLMEVLVMIDALKRASAARITAAIPYFGYARQDRRPRSARVPISAKVVAEVMNIIGDVEGRSCVIMDDIVDTANTLCKAATALKEHGAKKVVAYCTHPVLSGGAVARIAESDMDEIVVTDTIPLSPEARACSRIRQLSCAQLLAETMTRISNEESVSSLFID